MPWFCALKRKTKKACARGAAASPLSAWLGHPYSKLNKTDVERLKADVRKAACARSVRVSLLMVPHLDDLKTQDCRGGK